VNAPPARILLVEDDATLLGLTETLLVESGYDVRPSRDPRAALALLDEDAGIDLLITDLSMPAMDGGDLAGAVRRIAPAVPILYVTGHDISVLRAHVNGNGDGTSYMQKPFTVDELRERVAALVGDPG
jgi:DNA-binding response OmpR family regulator